MWNFSTENPIRIDISGCKYPDRLHEILRDCFGFPKYYGKNWDAFWDCISEMFFVNDTREVQIIGFHSLPKELREYCKPMLEIFRDLHKEHPGVTFQILSWEKFRILCAANVHPWCNGNTPACFV